MIRQLRDLDLQVDIVPRLFEIVGPSAGINVFEGLSVVALPPRRLSRGRLVVKRAVDIIAVATAAIIAILPIAVGHRGRNRRERPVGRCCTAVSASVRADADSCS